MEDLQRQHQAGMDGRPAESRDVFRVVLTGNPNCGKTTLFNALTGLRARVGNYAGVTVERKEGALTGGARVPGPSVTVLDLPGTYSLVPQSVDERIARDVLLGRQEGEAGPGLVVIVVDASNLQRNLYYAMQVVELGHPTVVALNMMDVAGDVGIEVDAEALAAELGVEVVPMIASRSEGVEDLRRLILGRASTPASGSAGRGISHVQLPPVYEEEVASLTRLLASSGGMGERMGMGTVSARAEALLLLSDDRVIDGESRRLSEWVREAVVGARGRLAAAGVDWRSVPIEARYARAAEIQLRVTRDTGRVAETVSDRVDRVLTHRVWGLVFFVAIMGLMFELLFRFAKIPMGGIEAVVDGLAGWVESRMPPGDLTDLISQGVIAGVGSVVVFLPQICLLFLFISLLEDTGYMARAAFLMDRLMSRVGLHGKSFIPMLSSFACAIPGIMATRTIESPKDRLVTMLVAPLMSCSARLPVYTVLIAACIPDVRVLGVMGLQGLVMLGMYLLGIAAALGAAWVFKRTLLKGEPPPLILELPPYKRPVPGVVLRHMWDRASLFLRRAGTVILGINILLWFLVSYPRGSESLRVLESERSELAGTGAAPDSPGSGPRRDLDRRIAGERLRQSFAGRIGRLMEPVLAPLGFDWKIGIGIVASFAAREVFVSTMSVVYNAGDGDDATTARSSLATVMASEVRPDGSRVYTPLTGVGLMVFYVFALQCVSTVAVMRRETGAWRWPVIQWGYMAVLAYVAALAVRWMGILGGLQ